LLLTDHIYPPVLTTSSNDIIEDFFIPALEQSIKYDRGVGFFSSGWFRIAAKGMVRFAQNGGHARWVTSPILDENDWNALLRGEIARLDVYLYEVLKKNIKDLSSSLETDTLSAISWMIADGIIDFKLALPRNKLDNGEFHDKFGIFTDAQGNQLVFNGSYNDSIQGTRNYESIKVFCSWDISARLWIKDDVERFETLWNNQDPNVQVFDLPSAAKEQIIKLRKFERPYQIKKPNQVIHFGRPISPQIPPSIQIREYQNDAIEAWFNANCRGLFEMATGTGKTITALTASIRLLEREKRLVVIAACPYQHLVDQWVKEAKNFGYTPHNAYQSKNTWLGEVNEKILAFNHNDIDSVCIITTHSTFSTEHFLATINRIEGPILIIADEAHHLGSEKQKDFLPEKAQFRLALSATPNRWFDANGTIVLREYFGEIVYSLSLPEAIQKGFLTPYYYYPVLVKLTDEEMVEYSELSTKIGMLMAQTKNITTQEMLERLLIKRANILNSASNKIGEVSKLISTQKNMNHTLFYCAPGQIDDVVQLLGWEKGLRIHRFTAEEDIPTRQRLLSEFSSEKLQALVAMRCLDEGVDVPSTRTAYILASSSNPREFIQRRGRILRLSPGKDTATIYDLIAIPPAKSFSDDVSLNAEKSLLKRELRRFSEFADSSLNSQGAYNVIWELAKEFGVLGF
jgi:DNA phosphorothioation system restriction enzyme